MPKWCAISWTTVIVHLLDHVLLGLADVADGLAVDHDPVGQRPAVVPAALGQREALVEPEQVGLLVVAVLDQDDDVVQSAPSARPAPGRARRRPAPRRPAGGAAFTS